MREDFFVYCLIDVSAPPTQLSRRRETSASFYMHISVPVPDRFVIFCLGPWDVDETLEAVLTYKDERITLGKVTAASSCICWEKRSCEVPAVMTSDAEKGMAKLVLEKPELDETAVSSKVEKRRKSMTQESKATTQNSETSKEPEKQKEVFTETPERQTKIKKRSKLEKTPNEPSAKKQKTQKSVTRLRSTKKDSDSDLSTSLTENITEENNTNKENQDVNISNCNISTDVLAEKKVALNNHMNNEKVLSLESDGMKKVITCKDLTTRALRPSSRWGHSLCFVNKNLTVLIGGQGEKQQINKDSVWTLDTETRKWRDPHTFSEGQKPEYRIGHTATYDPMVRCIYVFGGSKNTRWFHDVHILDIDEWKWQLVKVNGKAPTRAYHSATLYRHELWIFGGVYPRPDPQPDGCSNDIHIFSPVMESWYSPIVRGEKPVPRSGHSATLINDQLVVFGGWDAPISYSDLHILDMSIVEWTEPKVTGIPPKPRRLVDSMSMFFNPCLAEAVFVLACKQCNPDQMASDEAITPRSRVFAIHFGIRSEICISWHASCALSGQRILIHGGYDGNVALDDTYVFNVDKLNWTQVKVENQPLARVGHKAVCLPYRHDNEEEDEVIVFGGGDNDGAYFEDLIGLYVPFVTTEELESS